MNEQIKKLHDQAFAETTDYYATMQRFAELIVRECANQVDNYWDAFENGYADKKILEHFGVEE